VLPGGGTPACGDGLRDRVSRDVAREMGESFPDATAAARYGLGMGDTPVTVACDSSGGRPDL